MSILIKGMEMPTNCGDCYFEQIDAEEDEYGDTCISYCLLTEWRIALSNRDDKKLPSCPLVEIPTPHGRLIDADALFEAMGLDTVKEVMLRNWKFTTAWGVPIIEAEEK